MIKLSEKYLIVCLNQSIF